MFYPFEAGGLGVSVRFCPVGGPVWVGATGALDDGASVWADTVAFGLGVGPEPSASSARPMHS